MNSSRPLGLRTQCSPQLTADQNTGYLMLLVARCSLPGILVSIWLFGLGKRTTCR